MRDFGGFYAMSYDPNQPYGQQGQPQPPYEQSGQPQWGQPEQSYGQTEYNPAQSGYSPTQPVYNQTQYSGPPPGYMPPPQQQPKKSRRWLWITLGIIGGLVVLGCAICGITAAMGVGFFAKVAGPTVAATEYYQAMKTQDYNKAYSYWDTSGVNVQGLQLSLDAFVALAEVADTTEGQITNFSVTPNTNDPSLVTVTVTRNGTPYIVQLQLHQVNGSWKIFKASNI
jgi:hypothetical protein